MKLSSKILLCYITTLVITGGLAMQVYHSGSTSQMLVEELTYENIPNLEAISTMQTELVEQERILYEFYATTDTAVMELRLRSSQRQFEKARIEVGNSHQGSADLAAINTNYIRSKKVAEQLRSTLTANSVDWDLARAQLSTLSELTRSIIPALDNLNQSIRDETHASAVATRQSNFTTKTLVVITCVLTILIGGFVAFYINRYLLETTHRRRLAMFPERNPNPVFSTDWTGELIYHNPSASRLLNSIEQVDTNAIENFQDDVRASFDKARSEHISHQSWEKEYAGFFLAVTLHMLPDVQACHVHLVDVTQRKRAEKKLEYRANYDDLTALPNRQQFESKLQECIQEDGDRHVVIGLLNLDRFKVISSAYGYETGDKLITNVAKRLSYCIDQIQDEREYHLFRFSGTTFSLIATGADSIDCRDISKHIDRELETAVTINKRCFYLTMSKGFSQFPEDGYSAHTLMRNANSALTRAISRGGNQYYLFDERLLSEEQEKLSIEAALREAIENKELELHFQPKVDAMLQKAKGFEALIRWKSADLGFVSPAVFIPIAEQSDLIIDIGSWVLEQACKQAKAWHDENREPIKIAINISSRQFEHPDFFGTVCKIIEENDVPTELIEFEITETLIMENIHTSIQLLERIKGLGISIALDDFGTGYSSLNYIKRFPIDALKIDRSFIANIENSEEDLIILKTIIELAQCLNLIVVAEGVETAEQYDILRDLNCQLIQGFYFSRPLTMADATEYLQLDVASEQSLSNA